MLVGSLSKNVEGRAFPAIAREAQPERKSEKERAGAGRFPHCARSPAVALFHAKMKFPKISEHWKEALRNFKSMRACLPFASPIAPNHLLFRLPECLPIPNRRIQKPCQVFSLAFLNRIKDLFDKTIVFIPNFNSQTIALSHFVISGIKKIFSAMKHDCFFLIKHFVKKRVHVSVFYRNLPSKNFLYFSYSKAVKVRFIRFCILPLTLYS